MLEYLYFSLVTSSQVYFHFDSSRFFSSIFSSTFESSFRVGQREGEDDFAYMFLRNTNCVSCCMLITQKAALFRHCKQICFYVSILPNCIFTLENVQLFLYHFFILFLVFRYLVGSCLIYFRDDVPLLRLVSYLFKFFV